MSALRARCPACRTLTAVAFDGEYECHACGRAWAAGLVRVPRAWGRGGERMAAAAALELPWPEAATVEEDSLAAQNAALARELPARPLVLGGCCCAHVGAVEALAAHGGRLGLVWLDAHGDLNTPETSPSGNAWGMPFRMILDGGAVAPEDAALVGARDLDPGELDFVAATGLDDDLERALAGVDGVYVALDLDVLEPGAVAVHMPHPGGLAVDEVERVLRRAAALAPVRGAGFSGLAPDPANAAVLGRFAAALGL